MVKSIWALALTPVLLAGVFVSPVGFAEAQNAPPPDRSARHAARYNFPPASRGDRFAPRGIVLKNGIRGWGRYGKLIKRVAAEQHIDPYVLGAYVWVESKFDPRQDYADHGLRALGLASVQATDHPRRSVESLKDPYTNLTITAKEFRHAWKAHDMAGTVMDVWYPNWRRRVRAGERIPVVKTPGTYVQAIANRYYALQEIDRHLRVR